MSCCVMCECGAVWCGGTWCQAVGCCDQSQISMADSCCTIPWWFGVMGVVCGGTGKPAVHSGYRRRESQRAMNARLNSWSYLKQQEIAEPYVTLHVNDTESTKAFEEFDRMLAPVAAPNASPAATGSKKASIDVRGDGLGDDDEPQEDAGHMETDDVGSVMADTMPEWASVLSEEQKSELTGVVKSVVHKYGYRVPDEELRTVARACVEVLSGLGADVGGGDMVEAGEGIAKAHDLVGPSVMKEHGCVHLVSTLLGVFFVLCHTEHHKHQSHPHTPPYTVILVLCNPPRGNQPVHWLRNVLVHRPRRILLPSAGVGIHGGREAPHRHVVLTSGNGENDGRAAGCGCAEASPRRQPQHTF